MTQNFDKQNKIAKIGEDIVKKSIEALYLDITFPKKFQKVIDVSEDKEYQDKDIDILILTRINPGRVESTQSFEIKTDLRTASTGNLFIETVTKRDSGKETIGWINKTTADYLLYYVPQDNVFYNINMDAIRKFIKEKHPKYVETYNKKEKAKNCGYLISIQKIQDYDEDFSICQATESFPQELY